MKAYDSLPEKCPAPVTAVALGMFDGLHLGHAAVLNALQGEASEAAKCVLTFSTSNAKPDAKTGVRLLSRAMRDRLLESFGVDYVFQPEFSDFRDMSPSDFAKNFLGKYLNAKTVFCGEDFRFGKNAAATADDLQKLLPNGVSARIVPTVNALGGAVKTTRIRGLIESGDVKTAAILLGRPFTIDFAVEHGRRLGRTLGWPTINQAFPEDFAVPRFGVYASVTLVGGARRASVTNIGVKPTVGSGHILAETYIQGFSGELYGLNTPVELVELIRDERKFESVEALKSQVDKDAALAVEILKTAPRLVSLGQPQRMADHSGVSTPE